MHPSPRSIAVNKLDEFPGRKSVTSTQQRLLEKLGSGEQQVVPTDAVPSVNHSEAKVPRLERVESTGETRVQKADATSSTFVTKDVGSDPQSNTMGLFDAMENQYFSPSGSTEAKPAAAEEFRSQPAHHG